MEGLEHLLSHGFWRMVAGHVCLGGTNPLVRLEGPSDGGGESGRVGRLGQPTALFLLSYQFRNATAARADEGDPVLKCLDSGLGHTLVTEAGKDRDIETRKNHTNLLEVTEKVDTRCKGVGQPESLESFPLGAITEEKKVVLRVGGCQEGKGVKEIGVTLPAPKHGDLPNES